MKATVRSIAAGSTLVVFALLAVASGGKKGADGEGGVASSSGGSGSIKQSCNHISALGRCTEYPEGSSFILAQGACNMIDAGPTAWSKDRCPNEKVVGKCVDPRKDALYKNETEFYYAPEWTTETAKKDCIDDAIAKGKTYTAGDWKPKDDEARGSCTRKIIGSKKAGDDQCEEWPYGSSTESWGVLKMNCSGSGDKLLVGKGCTKEQKDLAVSKCVEKNGSVVYNFPPDATNAKDHCESEPSSGVYTKLKGTAPAATGGGGGTKPAGTAKPPAKK